MLCYGDVDMQHSPIQQAQTAIGSDPNFFPAEGKDAHLAVGSSEKSDQLGLPSSMTLAKGCFMSTVYLTCSF